MLFLYCAEKREEYSDRETDARSHVCRNKGSFLFRPEHLQEFSLCFLLFCVVSVLLHRFFLFFFSSSSSSVRVSCSTGFTSTVASVQVRWGRRCTLQTPQRLLTAVLPALLHALSVCGDYGICAEVQNARATHSSSLSEPCVMCHSACVRRGGRRRMRDQHGEEWLCGREGGKKGER